MIAKLVKYQLRNVLRSRWVFFVIGFFFVFTEAVYQASGSSSGMEVSLMSIVLIVLPLFSAVFGTMYVYGSREFLEVLVAQPLLRRDIFLSSWLVVSGAIGGCFLLGTGIPLLIHRIGTASLTGPLMLLAAGLFLTTIFTSLAFAVSIRIHDRARGVGVALLLWFFFAILYDGIVLFAFYALSEYPVEPLALAFSFFNPVDLARILLTLQFDVSALMGYTGAVYQRFFGGALGMLLSATALLTWALVPLWLGNRFFHKKDF
jgi:Cu-processing system permease protein